MEQSFQQWLEQFQKPFGDLTADYHIVMLEAFKAGYKEGYELGRQT